MTKKAPRVLILFILLLCSNAGWGQPGNDNCNTARPLCPSVLQSANNIDATSTLCNNCEDDFNFCFAGENTVWFTFNTNMTGGDVQIDFSNLQFENETGQGTDLQAAVIQASVPCVSSSYNLISNCEAGSNGPFTLSANGLPPGETYYLVVNGAMGASSAAEATFDLLLSGDGVERTPLVAISADETTICKGNQAVFYASTQACSDSSTFSWFINDTLYIETAAGEMITNEIEDGDKVTAEITCYDSTDCPVTVESNSVQMEVLDFELDAGPDLTVDEGGSIQLQATSEVDDVSWSPAGGMNNPNLINPVVQPQETTTYFLTGDNGTCTITDEMVVTLRAQLEIANTFSPNGDGINDSWEIVGIDKYPNADVRIFTRWGQLVFQSTGYTQSKRWDGTSKSGKALAPSAYFYVIDLRSDDFEEPIKGTVTLVK